jgi:HEAT repeat protein
MGLLKGLSAGKSKTLPDDPDGLVALLWDPSSDRKAVIAALVKIGAPAVEPLIKILEKPNIREVHRPVRDASATALANIGEPAAKALVRVFKLDPDLAEDALAALGPPVAELLVAILSEKNYYVRSRAACLLKGFGWQPRNDEERLLWDIACERWEEIDALSARLGASAIEPLNGALKNLRFFLPNKKYEIATIAKALGHTRDVRAVEVLLTTLDYIGYHQPEIEREIKFALSELRNAHGVTVTEIILARRKQKESSATVVNLLMDLSWSWRAEDVPALLEALHDGTAEVRYWSAFALGRTKS